jgi:hypothetical protein
MKKTLGILLMLFVLIACGEKQKSLADYEAYKVKVARKNFNANNGEYSILLPEDWDVNEDPIVSDTLLYVMETGSSNTSLVAMGIMKMNVIYGNIDDEFDNVIKEMTTRASNVKLVEKSHLKIGNKMAQAALLTYEFDGKIIQEEIDIFIPINDAQYYSIGLICDKNKKTEHHFGMMIDCAKTFELNK